VSPSAVEKFTSTGWSYALLRRTVKTAVVVPVFPSATVTSSTEIEGAFAGGQTPSLSSTETLSARVFAETASTRPSPLKSPTAVPAGYLPTA
jgi:hypothetical protein